MKGGGIQKITVEIGGKIASSLTGSLRAAQAQVSTFGRNVNRTMNDSALSGRKAFKSMFDNAAWQQATIGATAFLGAMGLSVKAAVDFDKSMADVRKAIDFKDGERGLKRFGNELVKLSAELPYTASELSRIAAAAGFAGYKESEIIPFTKAAARMGIAFQMSAEQAGESMVALRASMGLTQPEVEKLGDAINYLSDKFQGTVNAADLTEVTRRIGAIGKAAGLTSEQVAGLGAAFLASGTPTEVAATGLKNFLNALTKGSQATLNQSYALATLFGDEGLADLIKTGKGKAKKAARGVAVDIAEELAKGMQDNPEKVIKSVLDRMAKLPADQRVSIAGALFGEESKAAIMPLLTNTKLIGQAFDLIRKESAFAGSMQKEFANQMATSGTQMKLAQNGVNALGISIGSALLPSINRILKAVTPLVVKFADWAQKNEGLVTTIAVIGTAVAGLVIALPVLAGLVASITTLAPVLGGIAAAITGPIGIAVLAIVGLGLAFKAAYDKLPWFRAAVDATMGAVSRVISASFAAIGAAFGGFVNWVGGLWKVFTGVLTGDFGRIQAGFQQATAGFGQMATAWGGWMNFILSGVRSYFGQVVSFILQTPGKVASVGYRIVQAILDGLKAKAGELFGWVSGAWGRIRSLVGVGGAGEGSPDPAGGTGPTPPRRSLGGAVRAGFPYIVGERRRELFVPGMDGAIVPRVARPLTAAALAGLLTAPLPAAAGRGAVTVHAPVTINASGGDAMEIRRQVELAFEDIQRELESSHRVLLND
jgi:TP901 family phage tail tape measure protein